LELELLTKNTEHIEKIASMQQDHARVAGFAEPMPPDSSVEDALRMTAFNLQRHCVAVIRQCETDAFTVGGQSAGLQNAALATHQMGERPVAVPDGPSRGTAFSLELPLSQMEVAA